MDSFRSKKFHTPATRPGIWPVLWAVLGARHFIGSLVKQGGISKRDLSVVVLKYPSARPIWAILTKGRRNKPATGFRSLESQGRVKEIGDQSTNGQVYLVRRCDFLNAFGNGFANGDFAVPGAGADRGADGTI